MRKLTVPDLGLQGKLAAILVVAVFIAIGIVGCFSISSMRNQLEKNVQESQMLLAKSFGAQVEQFFHDAEGVVKMTAQLPAVKDVSSISLIRDDIKGVPREVDRPKRDVMNDVVKHYGNFGYMEQITPGIGNNIVLEPWQYQLDLQRLDFGFRDWAKSAVAKMDIHISEVYISSSLQKPVIAISYPVTDDNGNVTAIWMGALTLDHLSELCKQLTYGKTGHAYLVDQNGTLAAYPDPELVKEIKNVTDVPMVERAMKGESGAGLFFDPLVQLHVLASYMPVGTTGWSIVVVQDSTEAFAPVRAAMNRVIMLCVILLVIAIFVALWFARSISRPIGNLTTVAGKVAEGDLTVEIAVNSKDEIGKLSVAFNHMNQNLRNLVMQIQSASKQLASSTVELSASAENVSAGSNDTASTVSQVASTVEQVTANARHIAATSAQAASYAREGNAGLNSIGAQMETIRRAAAASREVTHGLSEAAEKISQIVELITSIADQTNLLALNAAIEAARAGEHGRGFAVVAEEVRKLAEQSAGAAKEIYNLINTIQHESQKAVQSMDQSAAQVEAGSRVVQDVGVTFEKIINTVQSLAGEIQAVAAATEEMSSSVQNVATTTEEQTAIMEEVASTTQDLARMAIELEKLAGHFKL